MRVFTWVHLSDLHVRPADYAQSVALQHLLRDLPGLLKGDRLQPDCVFVTGDVTATGATEEFTAAEEYLDTLVDRVKPAMDPPFFIVPGNHDVHWPSVDSLAVSFPEELLNEADIRNALSSEPARRVNFMGLNNYFEFSKRIMRGAVTTGLETPESWYWKYLAVARAGVRVGIVGLTTCWRCNKRTHGGAMGQLLVGVYGIRDAVDTWRQLPTLEQPDILVVLGHHPTWWLHEAERDTLESLIGHTADFYLHGHEHRKGFLLQRGPESSFVQVSAGPTYEKGGDREAHPLVVLAVSVCPDSVSGNAFFYRYRGEPGRERWEPYLLTQTSSHCYPFKLPVDDQAPWRARRPEAQPEPVSVRSPAVRRMETKAVILYPTRSGAVREARVSVTAEERGMGPREPSAHLLWLENRFENDTQLIAGTLHEQLGPHNASTQRGAAHISRELWPGCSIRVAVDLASHSFTPPRIDGLRRAVSLALLAAIEGSDLSGEVAICEWSEVELDPQFDDALREALKARVGSSSVSHASCDRLARECPWVAGLIWVFLATPEDTRRFLRWKTRMPLVSRQLRHWSSKKHHREIVRKYTALDVKGGSVPIYTQEWHPYGPSPDAPLVGLDRAIEQNEHVVILGDPGFGKSWGLLAYAHRLIRQSLGTAPAGPHMAHRICKPLTVFRFPVYISLKELMAQDVRDFIIGRLRGRVEADPSAVVDLLADGCFILLLDSLNEVAGDRYDDVTAALRGFRELYYGNRFVFASRTHNYSPRALDISDTYWIQPLSQEQQKTLTKKYLADLKPEDVDRLLEHIQKSAALRELCKNPLILALILDRYQRAGAIPDSKRQVLEDSIKGQYDLGRGLFPVDWVIDVLSGLALYMVDQRNGATLIDEQDALVVLRGELDRTIADRTWVDSLPHNVLAAGKKDAVEPARLLLQELLDTNILRRHEQWSKGDRVVSVTFGHQSYQEFLAGRRFMLQYRDSIAERLKQKLESMTWDEAAVLLVPYIAPNEMRDILAILVGIDIVLAVRCLMKAREEGIQPATEGTFIEELAAIAANQDAPLGQRRVAIEALAQMATDPAARLLLNVVENADAQCQLVAAELAAQHKPPGAWDIVTIICRDNSGANLGSAASWMLKLDFERGVRTLPELVDPRDGGAVGPILDVIQSNISRLSKTPEVHAIVEEWLQSAAHDTGHEASVRAFEIVRSISERAAKHVPIEAIRAELNMNDAERRDRAIGLAKETSLREATPDLLRVLRCSSGDVRKKVEDSLVSIAEAHRARLPLEAIRGENEVEDCLAIIATACEARKATENSAFEQTTAERTRIGEQLTDLVITARESRGWAAAFSLSLLDNDPALENRLLQLATGADEALAARALFALRSAADKGVIMKIHDMIQRVPAERLWHCEALPTATADVLRELAYAIGRLHSKAELNSEKEEDTIINLRRLEYSSRWDSSHIQEMFSWAGRRLFPLTVTVGWLAEALGGSSKDDTPERDARMLARLLRSDNALDRHAAILHVAQRKSEYKDAYRAILSEDEFVAYLEEPRQAADLYFALHAAATLRYDALLPSVHKWLNPDATLPPQGQVLRWHVTRSMIQSAACKAIGSIGKRESIGQLAKAWRDCDATIQKEIGEALTAIGPDQGSLEIYERLFLDSAPQTAEIIVGLLEKVGNLDTACFLKSVAADACQVRHLRDIAWKACQALQKRLRKRVISGSTGDL